MKQKIMDLLNFELKKKKINFTFTPTMLLSKNIYGVDDDLFYTLKTYYKFIQNDNSLKVFEKIYVQMKNFFETDLNKTGDLIKKNNVFVLSL
jgi:hypothetical protein